MDAGARRSTTRRRLWRGAALAAVGLLLLAGLVATAGVLVLRASRPQLTGTVRAPGLSAAVEVTRDAAGVPTLTGADRGDLAWALGFLHGQERFFQMDLLRRAAAGELAALLGNKLLPVDRRRRVHRFRARAEARLASLSPEERRVTELYTAGVNAGLTALGARPFEYLLLRTSPQPWRAEDILLVSAAMYFDLQEDRGWTEWRRGLARDTLGPALADFLYPTGTSWDAALDGTQLPSPPLPHAEAVPAGPKRDGELRAEDPVVPGSNNWAVGGALSVRGAALVANDMHLTLRVPNIWYRARLVVRGEGAPALDITGVTLPGTPPVIAGSNRRVAWGYTNSFIDTSDVVVLEPVEGDATRYRTPAGPRALERTEERICSAHGACEALVVEESTWGPVVGTDAQGRKLAYRWAAHDAESSTLAPQLALERATSVAEAVALAHRAGQVHNNFVVGDREGNVAWTLIGRVPRRFGHDGRLPTSWADGTAGWEGYLPPDEVPTLMNPAGGRVWTANSRVVGGEALRVVGEGNYVHASRARQIRDALHAAERFDERALLAIQLDDRGTLLERWQGLLLAALEARAGGAQPGQAGERERGEARLASLLPAVRAWGGRAVPESVGYRLVRTFRLALVSRVYGGLSTPLRVGEAAGFPASDFIPFQADEPAWRLLSERPAHLVPAGFDSWDAVVTAALEEVWADVEKEAGGEPSRYTWGARNRAAVRHPLSPELPPLLASLLDAPDAPLPGDSYTPRAQGPGFGASERFVVAPGHEEHGLFHMPGGQSGHPLAPYYLAGHEDWAQGRPSPFLPGPAAWSLRLEPDAAPAG